MSWNAIVEKVTPYVIKIETPRGHGTGFLCLYSRDRSFYGIATARHVITYADEWQQPIRLHHFPSGTSVFLKEDDRAIWSDINTDSALILSQPSDLKLPEEPIPLLPTTVPLAIGTEVGWLGFPALASSTLCFFSGNISARQEMRHAYLIDGVAINGVSGGPVVYSTDTDGVQIVGTISAYISNKATGDTLPGLSIARDLSHFHDSISQLRSLDEAKEKKQSPEQQKVSTDNPPSTEPTPKTSAEE
jgi:hypothetical protein